LWNNHRLPEEAGRTFIVRSLLNTFEKSKWQARHAPSFNTFNTPYHIIIFLLKKVY